MNEDRYTNVVLEEMRDMVRVIHEITVANQPKIDKIDGIGQDIKELKTDMKIVKKPSEILTPISAFSNAELTS